MFFPQRAYSAVRYGSSPHLPSPKIPVVPLDRHSRRSFSTGSFTITICRLAFSTISASCRELADCGLLNIPEIRRKISERVYISEEAVHHSLSLMSTDRCSWKFIVQIQTRIIKSRNMSFQFFRSGASRSKLLDTASRHCVIGARSFRGSVNKRIFPPPRHSSMELRCSSSFSQPRRQMEMSIQLDSLAALPLQEELRYPLNRTLPRNVEQQSPSDAR